MRFAKEKIHELKEKVRFEMVKNPHISILELQGILGYNYGHKFDKNFIGKLKRKVHRERAMRLNFVSLNEDIAVFEDLIRYGRQFLVDIVFNDDGKYTPMQIIAAFRNVIWAESTLIDMKLNCGTYQQVQHKTEKEKPLTPEQQENINRGLDMIFSITCDKCVASHHQEGHQKNT
ncbi:MAG: hypothetical protein A3F15_01935 [Candidatus Wildermuthbacteria bacterium RIFCSPHIGHO2_12_FULL_40_12]|uniref:Uncharacterized protein n=1 Tax=Candidatus Wildermuthbacteria bacterium RIFCSPHIGHO2_12_FULL_40_12 TaxID=1802457 RepID=A0A1G2RC13_9BACT|nr:MAG: hypothetical protein A3F15_01935 [Candidatus Wildermuthbacteria bacterium RIFCSPHIGHO2_12_FULL_40_12]HXK40689.1 hypothetical protein [Candidatus Paceibacterota bacterium]